MFQRFSTVLWDPPTTHSSRWSLHTAWNHVCVLNVLLSSRVRYEERAPDSARGDQDFGGSDSEETEEWVLVINKWTLCWSRSFCSASNANDLHTGIESKKGDEDGKYIPINTRMQRTQVKLPFFWSKAAVLQYLSVNLKRQIHKTITNRSTVTQMVPFLQHGVLSKEFVELMGHCNTIQAQYRDRNVERIQRQLKISEFTHQCVWAQPCAWTLRVSLHFLIKLIWWRFVSSAGTNVTDDELDTMLESGQTDVFTQNVSTSQVEVSTVQLCRKPQNLLHLLAKKGKNICRKYCKKQKYKSGFM